MKNVIKVQGKIIKVESSKKGYGYTLKDLAGKQSYFYNNWKLNIFLRQDYIFYLNIKPGQNKYYYLYQSHKLVSPINSEKVQEELRQGIDQQIQLSPKFYQQYQAQEIQRLKQLLSEQQSTSQNLTQRIKLLEKLLKQKEAERLTEISQYQSQLKEKTRIIKLNELELEKKISPYNSIESLYYKEHKSPEQEKYLWELTNLFNKDNPRVF